MTDRAREVLQGVYIDNTRIGNDLAIRLMEALASANLRINPAYHRISISQLALAFGVSDEKAQQAVEKLGVLYREPAQPPTKSGTPPLPVHLLAAIDSAMRQRARALDNSLAEQEYQEVHRWASALCSNDGTSPTPPTPPTQDA